MSVKLSQEKNELVENVARREGFENFKVQVTQGSMKGDGYLGIINTIEIQDVYRIDKRLHLIMKSAMTDEKLRENTPVRKAYEREIYLYQTVFPEFEKLSQETGISNKFKEVAKCYGSLLTDQQECIVLENLKENNFKLWNRKMPMNEDHVALVFQTYAKFHATGIALKLLKPEKFEKMSQNLVNIFHIENPNEEEQKKMVENCNAIYENGFKAVANNERATKAFAKYAENWMNFFAQEVVKVTKYSTIIHGDCWCNNMMFKYTDLQDPLKPTEMRLLDWQISQVGSLMCDLSYFFYVCGSKKVFYDLKKFLKIYHDSFSKTIKEAGLNPEEVLTFEELENHWKFLSKYGLFMTLLVTKVILSEVEEAPDLSEMAKEGKNILESITSAESTKNIEAVNARISDVIIFMMDNDYL